MQLEWWILLRWFVAWNWIRCWWFKLWSWQVKIHYLHLYSIRSGKTANVDGSLGKGILKTLHAHNWWAKEFNLKDYFGRLWKCCLCPWWNYKCIQILRCLKNTIVRIFSWNYPRRIQSDFILITGRDSRHDRTATLWFMKKNRNILCWKHSAISLLSPHMPFHPYIWLVVQAAYHFY